MIEAQYEIIELANVTPKIAIYFRFLNFTYFLFSEIYKIIKFTIAENEVAKVKPTCLYCLYKSASKTIFVNIAVNDEITGVFLSL